MSLLSKNKAKNYRSGHQCVPAWNSRRLYKLHQNLTSEVEGILRDLYFSETGIGNNVRSPALIAHIVEKGKAKARSESSLIPAEFLGYLKDIIFAGSDLETGPALLSRNSATPRVASEEL